MNRTVADALDFVGGRISSHAVLKETCDAVIPFYVGVGMTTDRLRLLEPGELAETGPAEAVRLPLELVDENPDNPRRALPEIDLLAASISDPEIGLLQPIVVRRAGERYQVIGGHRRLAAFRLLREARPHEVAWRTIPAVVRTMESDDTAYLALLSAQVHTRNWKPRDEAAALERLVLGGRSLTEVGQVLHRSRSWASTRLRIYSDSVLSGFVQAGRLPPGVAQELLLVKDPETRLELARRAADETWGLDKARAEVRRLRIDRELSQANRLTRTLLELLSSVTSAQITTELWRELWTLDGRITKLGEEARGGKPKMPTIEQAERVAGVKTQERPLRRGQRRKPGYKPKV